MTGNLFEHFPQHLSIRFEFDPHSLNIMIKHFLALIFIDFIVEQLVAMLNDSSNAVDVLVV